MRNIKNLKDPTTSSSKIHAKAATKCCCWSLILLLLLLPIYRNNVMAQWPGEEASGTTTSTNVSCIEHDGKYTCDCRNEAQPMLLPPLYGNVFQVEISNCRALTIHANTLGDIYNLHRIVIKHVAHLMLHKYALTVPHTISSTPVTIEFEEVHFELIDSHAINGNIGEIAFIGGSIAVIQPFGVTTTRDRATLLKLDSVRVQRIEQQAFKKFVVENLKIHKCIFESNVPSRAFYDLEVPDTFSMQDNRFREVYSHAFSFKLISKLIITGNSFTRVDGEWFEAFVRDTIIIRDNNFGITSEIAFRRILLHRDYNLSEHLELRFINNTVQSSLAPEQQQQQQQQQQMQHHEYQPRPLVFNDKFTLNIKQLQYNNAWTCQALDMTQKPIVPKSVFFRQYSDNIYFRRGDMITVTKPTTTTTNTATNNADNNSQSFIVLSKIIEWDCQQSSYVAYIVIGSVIAALLIVLVVLIIWCQIARKRKRRKMDVVVPEPRTYKETQIIYQIENAGLLKTDL